MLKSTINHLTCICSYMVTCHPCNSRLVLPAFNKRHLCQNLFLSLVSLLRPHVSAVFPSPPQHLMSGGALKTEGSKTLALPAVFSVSSTVPASRCTLPVGNKCDRNSSTKQMGDGCTPGPSLGISTEGFKGQFLL